MTDDSSLEQIPSLIAKNEKYWIKVYQRTLAALKQRETWDPIQKPLLDNYIYALREAFESRAAADEYPYIETARGEIKPHPGYLQADRAERRAILHAKVLRIPPDVIPDLIPSPQEEPEAEASDLSGL